MWGIIEFTHNNRLVRNQLLLKVNIISGIKQRFNFAFIKSPFLQVFKVLGTGSPYSKHSVIQLRFIPLVWRQGKGSSWRKLKLAAHNVVVTDSFSMKTIVLWWSQISPPEQTRNTRCTLIAHIFLQHRQFREMICLFGFNVIVILYTHCIPILYTYAPLIVK